MVALLNCSVGHASCGGYVYSRFRMPTYHGSMTIRSAEVNSLDVAESEILRVATLGLPFDVAESGSQPSAPAPCHGPNCSENPTPLVPFPPPAIVGSSNQDRLIFGHSTIELPCSVSLREDLHNDARARRGFPLLIEMPPENVG